MISKIHLVGNAHIDPVWLWRWQEGLAEIKATFQSALDRMNEFPEFIFTSACAAYYEWIEENSPEMFEEIKQRIQEGRWVIAGGWWIQPDCNIPSGESFVRHGLYSQRYFKTKFGVTAKVGYNVDSFGHNGMLPQILKKSGMDFYVFSRPGDNEKNLPGNLFWWESMDGSRVMAYKIPISYATGWGLENDVEIKLNKYQDLFGQINGKFDGQSEGQLEGQNEEMMFYGVGNHGGGPTISNLKNIRQLQQKLGKDKIIHSSPEQYFNDVSKYKKEIPLVKDDLQHHASGCYSTHSQTKKSNRIAEHRLVNAEKFMSISHFLVDYPYDGHSIQKAWKNVLFNQFHDTMGGCSIKEAYDDAAEFYGESLKIGAWILNGALQKITWAIDTSKTQGFSESLEPIILSKEMDGALWEYDNKGIPLVVFNPLSWQVKVPIQVNKNVKAITDEQGNVLEIQTVRASQTNHEHDKWDTLFIAKVPALGYRVYWIYKNKEISSNNTLAAVDEININELCVNNLESGNLTMENKLVKIEIDEHTGYIKQLFDKENNINVFSNHAAVPILIDEYRADTWAHGIFSFRNEIGKFGDAQIKVIEEGHLRIVIRATSKYNNSVLQQDYILYKDKKDIEVRVKLNWQEKHKMLKLSFPVNVSNSIATYEIPYGHIERPANGEEEPGQQWVDVYGKLRHKRHQPGTELESQLSTETYGLALLNDCKYSFDVKDNDLRMTVVRSPIFADHYGKRDELCEFMDQGVQEFKYVLVPHKDNWRKVHNGVNIGDDESGIVRKAIELNTTFPYVIETYHKGCLPQSFNGISISEENIVAVTLKRGEDGDSYILRCYETFGKATDVIIELPFFNRKWQATFGPCEIKTFKLPDDANKPIEITNLLEYD